MFALLERLRRLSTVAFLNVFCFDLRRVYKWLRPQSRRNSGLLGQIGTLSLVSFVSSASFGLMTNFFGEYLTQCSPFAIARWHWQYINLRNLSSARKFYFVLTRTPRLKGYRKTQIWGVSDFRISLKGVFWGKKVYRVVENSTLRRMRLVSTLCS